MLSEGNEEFPRVSLLCWCRRVAELKQQTRGGCKCQGVTYRPPVGTHTTSVLGGMPSPGPRARLGGSEGSVPCITSHRSLPGNATEVGVTAARPWRSPGARGTILSLQDEPQAPQKHWPERYPTPRTNTSGCWQQPSTARSEKQSPVKGSTTGARRGFPSGFPKDALDRRPLPRSAPSLAPQHHPLSDPMQNKHFTRSSSTPAWLESG